MNAKGYASIGTALVAALTIGLMMCTHLSLESRSIAAADKGEVVIEETYFDVLETVASPNMQGIVPAAAQSEEHNQSQPTPASGTDLENSGQPGEAPEMVASTHESPVTQAKPEKPAGPSAEELRKQEEARQAQNEVTNAFSHASGSHNTTNGSADNGNAGQPNSQTQQGAHTGSGEGYAGDGWALPAYGKVKSPVTGSVKMTLTIDREGRVTNVQFTGGQPPAATNQAVRNACAVEVRSRRFTRSNPETAPETSKAYITYTFK